MEEANSDSFALNQKIMGSLQKPFVFDSENGRILYGHQTFLSLHPDQSQWLTNLLASVAFESFEPEKTIYSEGFNVLDNLKKEEVDLLRVKHLGSDPEPPMWMPGSGHCPVPRGPKPC